MSWIHEQALTFMRNCAIDSRKEYDAIEVARTILVEAEQRGRQSVCDRLKNPDDAMIEATARKLAGQYMREMGYSEKLVTETELSERWHDFTGPVHVALAALVAALEADVPDHPRKGGE